MAGDVSFDVVSDFDEQELRNALDQVRREVGQRYDFKGGTVDLTQEKDELILVTDDDNRASAVKDLIESKAIRRELSLKIFDWGAVEPAGGNKVRQQIEVLTSAGVIGAARPAAPAAGSAMKWTTSCARTASNAASSKG